MADGKAGTEPFELTKEFMEKAMVAMLTGKATLKDFRGIDDAQMEAMYAMGYNFYQSGRNDDAQKVFQTLTILDNLEPKYWMGLGATFHEDEKWENAAACYQMALVLDLKDPQPPYRLAECYAKLGFQDKVEGCVEALEKLADSTGTDYLEKAKRLLAGMKEV